MGLCRVYRVHGSCVLINVGRIYKPQGQMLVLLLIFRARCTPPETKTETQKGPYEDYTPFNKSGYMVSMLLLGNVGILHRLRVLVGGLLYRFGVHILPALWLEFRVWDLQGL